MANIDEMERPLEHVIKQCTDPAELCELVSTRLPEFQPNEISTAFRQLSFLSVTERSGRIDESANKMVDKANAEGLVFTPDQIADLLSAHAKMRKSIDTALLKNLTAQAIQAAPRFEARALSNTLAALSKMQIKPDEQLLEALSERAKVAAPEFSPQSVANTLSAMSDMGVQADVKMVEKLSERASLASDYFRPEDAVKTLNALSTMPVQPDKKMLAALGKRATAGVDGTQDGAASLFAMATMGLEPEPGQAEELCQRTVGPAAGFGPKEVSKTLWALAKLGVRSPGAAEVGRVGTARSGSLMSSSAASTTSSSSAASAHRWQPPKPARDKALPRLPRSVSSSALVRKSAPPSALSAINLTSLSKMGGGGRGRGRGFGVGGPKVQLAEELCRRGRVVAGELDGEALATTLWALATMGWEDQGLVMALGMRGIMGAGSFGAGQCATVLWAAGSMGTEDPALVEAMAEQLRSKAAGSALGGGAGEFTAEVISDALWGMATAGGGERQRVVAALSAHGALQGPRFSVRQAADSLWALAKLGTGPEAQRFIDALSHRLKETAGGLAPEDVPRTFWALATIGVKNPERKLVEVVGDQGVRAARKYGPREVSDCLWGLATLGAMHLALVQALCKRVSQLAHRFQPQDLANTLWALATLGFNADPTLMSSVDRMMVRQLSERARAMAGAFNPKQLADTLWALSTTGHEDQRLVEALSAQAAAIAPEFRASVAADAMWGLHIAGVHNKRLVQAYMGQAAVPPPDFGVIDPSLYADRRPRPPSARRSSSARFLRVATSPAAASPPARTPSGKLLSPTRVDEVLAPPPKDALAASPSKSDISGMDTSPNTPARTRRPFWLRSQGAGDTVYAR